MNSNTIQNSVTCFMVCLDNCPRLAWSPPSPDPIKSEDSLELCRFLQDFLDTVAECWTEGIQAHIPLIQTLSGTPSLSLWLPSNNCPKLAWSPPSPDSIHSNTLQNSGVFSEASFTQLLKSGLKASGPRIHECKHALELIHFHDFPVHSCCLA